MRRSAMPRVPAALPGTRQRLARWAIVGALVGALLALVLAAPANWLAAPIASASEQRVLLADARGSLWSGNAVLLLTGGPGSRDASALPGRLHWRLRPTWHGGPALSLQFEHACCINDRARLVVRPGFGRVAVELEPAPDWIARWPTSWLGGLGTPWNTLELGGWLELRSPGLRLETVAGRWRVEGSATLELRQLSSRLSTLPSLGSYRLSLQADPADSDRSGAALILSTLDGVLRLDAQGRWDGTGLRLRGEAAAAEPGAEAALGNLLNIIGRRQGARSVISIG